MTSHSADTVDGTPNRVALLSDVHGNLPAFRSVLEDVRAAEPDEIWCLGDLVGYGAQPRECIELARETCDLCLAGNHDLVVTGEISIEEFSAAAAAAAAWTQQELEQEALEYLRSLEPRADGHAIGLFHASPRDPVWEYVLSSWQAEECLELMESRIAAIGHSHVALFFRAQDGGRVMGAQAEGGTKLGLSDGRWLINPGGVGQPRDGDARAAWLLLDTGDWTAEWRRVEYPIDEAAEAIVQAGLPKVLAERLYSGQ